MTLVLRHVALPAAAPLALVVLYFTPLTVLGCRDRGLLALAVLAVSTVAALVCAGLAVRDRGNSAGTWWILSAAILVLPAALLLGPLG